MMDSKFSVSKPRYFSLKKWTLVAVMTANIFFLVICMFYADKLVEFAMRNVKDVKPEQEEDVKNASKIMLLVICVIGIFFEFLFIYGVVKKNICLCTTYAVMAVLGTLIIFVQAFQQPIFWVNACFGVAISTVAILYVRDLKFIRKYMKGNKRLQSV